MARREDAEIDQGRGSASPSPTCSPSSILGNGTEMRGGSQMERMFWAYLETKIQQRKSFNTKKQRLLDIINADLPENLDPIVYEAIMSAI